MQFLVYFTSPAIPVSVHLLCISHPSDRDNPADHVAFRRSSTHQAPAPTLTQKTDKHDNKFLSSLTLFFVSMSYYSVITDADYKITTYNYLISGFDYIISVEN